MRVAAVTALGPLGDAQAIPVLLNAAASTNTAVQKAARDALLVLHRGEVTESLLAQLSSTQPGVQAEVIRALSGRVQRPGPPISSVVPGCPSGPALVTTGVSPLSV